LTPCPLSDAIDGDGDADEDHQADDHDHQDDQPQPRLVSVDRSQQHNLIDASFDLKNVLIYLLNNQIQVCALHADILIVSY
jgi:hypothetical protein